jgi:hypothetical protein
MITLPSVRRRLRECLRMDLPLLGDVDIRGFHHEKTDHPLFQNHKQCLQGLKHRFYTLLQCCGTVTIYYGSGSGSDF